MRAVNLLPRDVETTKTRQLSPPVVTGVVAAIIVVTILAAGFVRESAKVSHKRTELDAARAELALVPAPVVQDSSSSTLASERTKRVTALQGALDGRVAWDRVLREISLVFPDDVWLSGLTLQAPASATPVSATGTAPTPTPTPTPTAPAPATPTAIPSDFTMNGKAFSHQGVARLLSRLALVPDLENVTLGHSTRNDAGKRGAVEFSVVASIRAPGGTP
jgi:Tfp pilus assembly protein PilN